jgi:penicillin-binding protein 2
MQANYEKKQNRRPYAVLAIFLVAITGLGGQLANLTLRQQDQYLSRADSQSTRTISTPAPRGVIYDRNLLPMADNRPAFRLSIHYPYYQDEAVIERLASLLDRDAGDIKRLVERQSDRPFEPVILTDDLSQVQYARIQERKQELPGVEVVSNPVRRYPNMALAGHLLGYVGTPAKDGTIHGKSGLELVYDSVLQGVPGEREVAVNSAFEPLGVVSTTQPKPGQNLVLTIDGRLQQVTERALDWQMHRLQTVMNIGDQRVYQNARAGAAVVMDVKTGAILAMASRPGFDPNLFIGGIAQSDWDKLNNDKTIPLLDRTVQAAYHPGSTWKMLSGAAAVTSGVTTPGERVFSGKVYAPTGQRDWVPGGHGWVDLVNALRLSSNIYFYEMGLRMGIDRQVEFAKAFGFGAPTGVDLEGESAGVLPDEAYRNAHDWTPGQAATSAIGQIFTVTPVQLARYATALANGGNLLKPYLVQEVRSSTGEVVKQTAPEVVGKLPISDATLQTLIQGMKLVNSPTGTSDFAQWPLPGIATAGKTGTAENPPQDDYGLYVGFAPADNPQIAVAAVIEQAGHGGSVSPVARTIWAEYFGVELPKNDPARVPDTFQPVQQATPAKP